MFVEKVKNNGKDYLRLAQSVRVTNKNGYKVSQKKVILNIGPLDRFDDGKPDYVERLKKSFKAGVPIIPELEPYCNEKKPHEVYRFSITEGSPDCFGHPKIYSHLFLRSIIKDLGLYSFFNSYKGFTKIQYDLYGFTELLIFGRILNPASKIATVKQNDDYYEPILKDYNPDNVYDTLSFIASNKDKIIRRINTNLTKKAGRSTELIYYDVTNFYYETEEPDEDILDDNGEITTTGLRKMGVSKENKKQPIVQMGLFMDNDGIPISIESFPGNTLDHLTFRPALKSGIDNLDYSRYILVADRGIFQYRNLLYLLDAGNGYIVSKSFLKSKNTEKQWAYDNNDYKYLGSDFKYKSRIIKHKVKDEKGSTREIEELVVVYWSKKYKDRCLKENKSFLDFVKKLTESPHNFKVTSIQAKGLRKFFRNDVMYNKTGELLNSKDLVAMIDYDKINQYTESLGYYQIVTSELTMNPLDVIEKYHGLSQIEDQFRVMKGDLETRPLFVRTKNHVDAHLLICMISLVIIRIIQKRILSCGIIEKNNDLMWESGLSGERIQEALNRWKVDTLPGDLYRFLDIDYPDLKLILDAFDINIPAKLYQRGELKSLIGNTKIFK